MAFIKYMKYKPTKWGLKLGVLAYMSGDIRDRNMRKETISCISEFSVLNAYNLESIVATDFNFGVKFLTSSCYTHKKDFLCHVHFQYGRGELTSQSHSKIAVLCFTLAVHHSIQEAYSSF